MKISNTLLRTALTGAFAIGPVSMTSAAFAADDSMEQCAGVVKAGKNDCATSMNACHGHVEADSNAMAWIYVPKGTCEKIAGAHTVTTVDPTPKAK